MSERGQRNGDSQGQIVAAQGVVGILLKQRWQLVVQGSQSIWMLLKNFQQFLDFQRSPLTQRNI